VFYGKKEVFTVKLANTGNGDAENVAITLLTVGTGENQPVSHNVGLLAAGEEKSLELELTARQTGNVQIRIDARGDGGVHAETAEKVLVRRAALQVDVEGPQMQYVGAVAAYRIRVTNPGNAPARNVKLSASVPPGGKYLSGIENSRLEANSTKVQWMIDTINPGVEQTFAMKCSLGLPGVNKVEVMAAADDELMAAGGATTRVEAMADLVLDVKDPARPVPLGEEAIYELRVRNRGTKSAEGVEVIAFFSRGVEAVSVEGGQSKIIPGQVVFQPISSVPAGGEVILKIRARAETAGNHVFRVEVHCKPLGTRLASEQTTHFYQDGSGPQQASRPTAAGSSSSETVPVPTPRTADRRELIPVPPSRSEPTPAPLR